MQKPKIYLDTSTISHLEQFEKPSEQAHTQDLFQRIKKMEFYVYLSSVVFDEINDCSSERKKLLLRHLAEIEFETISVTEEIMGLAARIIQRGILPKRSIRDSQHIASALVAGCDYIVSWKMKHMSNVKTNKNIRHITIDEGYKEILLVPPSMILGEEVFDDEND